MSETKGFDAGEQGVAPSKDAVPALSDARQLALSAPLVQRLAESIQQIVSDEMHQRAGAQRAIIEQLLRANQEMGEVLRRLVGQPAEDEGPAEQQVLANGFAQPAEPLTAPLPPEPDAPPLAEPSATPVVPDNLGVV